MTENETEQPEVAGLGDLSEMDAREAVTRLVFMNQQLGIPAEGLLEAIETLPPAVREEVGYLLRTEQPEIFGLLTELANSVKRRAKLRSRIESAIMLLKPLGYGTPADLIERNVCGALRGELDSGYGNNRDELLSDIRKLEATDQGQKELFGNGKFFGDEPVRVRVRVYEENDNVMLRIDWSNGIFEPALACDL